MRQLWLAICLFGAAVQPISATAQESIPTPPPHPLFGVNFINSVDHPASERQFANGTATGAGWNRWPLYWNRIETRPNTFDWDDHDAAVAADIAHGFQIDAILLGTPAFYTTSPALAADCAPAAQHALNSAAACQPPTSPSDRVRLRAVEAAAPIGLHDPIFSDGSDEAGADKTINPANRWAVFVYTIVQRYKPEGTLAQAEGWPAGAGITHWEMWNEPDFPLFWDSSPADYARLLKVGYLAAKQADPQAQIIFGGLANNGDPNYYRRILTLLAADEAAAAHAFYHDIFATHNYSLAWESWYHVWRAERTLRSFGLSKPIWLNESGVPAWDDYPGPTWDPKSGLRATTAEQADFVLQSAFYALYAGAEAIFHFQLYDGCGNQPAGTDFPPHNGELCTAEGKLVSDPSKPCAGDANGLFTNPADAMCFAQHPHPESPRPSFTAFQFVTTNLTGVTPLWRIRAGSDDPYNGPQEWIALYRPRTGERIVALWSRDGATHMAALPATSSSARLIFPDGSEQTLTPTDGLYQIELPPATNQNAFWDPTLYMIGGRTRILIEAAPPPKATYLPWISRP